MSKKKKNKSAKNSQKSSTKAEKPSAKPVKKVAQAAAFDWRSTFWVNQKFQVLLIFALSCILYINTVPNQYAVDDSIVILRNQFTKKGWAGMPGIWQEDTFTGFFGRKRNLVAGGRYRPLSLASFALELQLFGEVIKDANGQPVLDKDGDVNYQGKPWISHFVNVLLYAILCVVIYLMLLQMFNPTRSQDNLKGYFIAFVGAILYTTHPIHTEAVANIKGRDEIMVLLGSVLAVYWVLKAAAEEGSREMKYHLGAILAFIFAIFSKENAVTFLAIIPAALYFFTRKSPVQISAMTLPYVLIVGIFWFGIRGPIIGAGSAVVGQTAPPSTELMNDPFLKIENNRYVPFTDEERVATVLYTWLKYVKLLVVPHPLTNDYYPKHIRTDKDIIPTFSMPPVLLSILLHLLLGLLMLWGILKKRAFAFFLLFYFATFSVVSNLIFPIGTNMAERFMFLPSVGFSALCAMGLYHFLIKAKETKLEQALRNSLLLLAVIGGLYSIKSITRNFDWYNDYTLFTTDIQHSPHSAKLNNAVSGVLQAESERTSDAVERKRMITNALNCSVKATNLHPTYNNAWLLRGNANVRLGGILTTEGGVTKDGNTLQLALNYFDEAIKAYKEVLRLRPDHPDVNRNLGVTYRDRGKLLGQYLGRLDESMASLEQAMQYHDKDYETLRLAGIAYGIKGVNLQQAGRQDLAVRSHLKAIEFFNRALELAPNAVPVLYNLEVAHAQLGQQDKVKEYHDRWFAINPNYDPREQ